MTLGSQSYNTSHATANFNNLRLISGDPVNFLDQNAADENFEVVQDDFQGVDYVDYGYHDNKNRVTFQPADLNAD